MDGVLLQRDDVFPSNACVNGLLKKTWQKNCSKQNNCQNPLRQKIRLAKVKVEFGRKSRIIKSGFLLKRKENYQKRLLVKRKAELSKAFFCDEKMRIIKSGCDKIEDCETAADLSIPVGVGQEGRDLRNFQERM